MSTPKKSHSKASHSPEATDAAAVRIAHLEKDNADLQSQLAAIRPGKTQGWEKDLQHHVKSNTQQVEDALREGNGLPNDYDPAKLYDHAHGRALAVGPDQFLERIKNHVSDDSTKK